MKGPDTWPCRVVIPKIRYQWQTDKWCAEKFGKEWSAIDNREGVWCCFWAGSLSAGSYEWFFKNEQDCVLFLLRWQ